MASTLAAYGRFTKCKEAKRRVKFLGNGKRRRKVIENVNM